MKDISRDERFFYQRGSTPLLLRCGLWVAALVCTAVTVSLIPLSDLLKPRVGKIIEFRPVDTVQWRPKPPPAPPKPDRRKKPEPPKPKPKADAIKPKAPEKPVPKSRKLRLPVKLDFRVASAVGDFELDFEIDPTVEVLPEVIETPIPEPEPEPEQKSLYELDELDSIPAVVSQSRPVYPYRARTRGIEGYVDVEFTVRPDGTTADIAVAGSKPPNIFEKAARQAVEKWRFSPGIRRGNAVDTRVRLRIQFDID